MATPLLLGAWALGAACGKLEKKVCRCQSVRLQEKQARAWWLALGRE
jgi:hypothetical protein